MNIYFVDGEIITHDCLKIKSAPLFTVDARNGYSYVDSKLEELKNKFPNADVLTNSIVALDNYYAWDEKTSSPNIWIKCASGNFVKITELTNRELREGHNLMKMYMAGEFEAKQFSM